MQPFRHAACAVATLIAALAAITAPAAAHTGDTRYRSQVTAIAPASDGLTIQVLNYDDRLALHAKRGTSLVIEGYDGEPYARVLPDGTVEVNRRSPATYLNDDRFGEVTVPKSADPRRPPDWQIVNRAGRFEWHDHRIHWMSRNLPPQVRDESKPAKVFDWSVPITIDGRRGAINGTLRWQPAEGGAFPVWAGLALGALVLAGVAAVIVVRRRRRPRDGAAPAPTEREAW